MRISFAIDSGVRLTVIQSEKSRSNSRCGRNRSTSLTLPREQRPRNERHKSFVESASHSSRPSTIRVKLEMLLASWRRIDHNLLNWTWETDLFKSAKTSICAIAMRQFGVAFTVSCCRSLSRIVAANSAGFAWSLLVTLWKKWVTVTDVLLFRDIYAAMVDFPLPMKMISLETIFIF